MLLSLGVHVLWGWMQIDKVFDVANAASTIPSWASYYPHIKNNERMTQNKTAFDDGARLRKIVVPFCSLDQSRNANLRIFEARSIVPEPQTSPLPLLD